MSNYFLTCFSGAKNMGDEFILKCLVEKIKQYDKSAQIVASSLDPEETKSLIGKDISAIEWHGIGVTKKSYKNMFNLYKEIKSTDYVVIGGGGLLQDVHSVATIPRYLITAVFAKFFNKKVIYFSMGVGPIKNKRLINLTKDISNKFVDFITVRDEKSKIYLRSIGVETEVKVTTDPVFSIEEFIKPVKSNNKSMIKKVGISFRQFKTTAKIESELEKVIEELSLSNKYIISLFPLDLGEDMELCNRLKKKFNQIKVIDDYIDIKDIVLAISEMDYMISMRLHGIITSASYGIPSVAISYDDKVRNMQTKIGMEDYIIDINEFTAVQCLEKFYKLESEFVNKYATFMSSIEDEKKIVSTSIEDSIEFTNLNNKRVKKLSALLYFVKLYIPQILKKVTR